ncbi:non-ribosomal peptide synthetase [Paenibacillus solani]|uniref:non-ribosomal peptide synthetase n=1 Tax=Paenibacillus solani TaxID=1705565 RepID=UPI003D273C33
MLSNKKEYIFDHEASIQKVFQATVDLYNSKTAITVDDNEYNFIMLNNYSNQLARLLMRETKPQEIIGIFMKESIEMIISIFAILKAGCTCLILDPNLPTKRFNEIIKDSKIELIICRDYCDVKNITPTNFLKCNLNSDFPYNESIENIVSNQKLTDISFLFYTSGSTGTPKGVRVSHGAILNDTHPMIAQPPLNDLDKFLFTSPLSSIRLIGELFYPLFFGVNVVILSSEFHNNVDIIIETIIREQITVLFVVPTLLREMVSHSRFMECKSLRLVQSMGEKLSKSVRDSFYKAINDVILVNIYGQTETGMCTVHYCSSRTNEPYNISGLPVINRIIYILNDNLTETKMGDIGNIYIGGRYLADGYLNDSALTHKVFLQSPFNSAEKIYKTGDVGRISGEGYLEFLGRSNELVKIGGMRVSLLEVESKILSLENVSDCKVVTYINHRQDNRLMALIIQKNGNELSAFHFRKALKHKLPLFMIPSRFIFVDKFPTNSHGKIDIQKIQELSKGAYHQSDTKLPAKLLDIISSILCISSNSIRNDDYFIELGGDSITAVTLGIEIEKQFDKQLPFEQLLYELNIQEISELLNFKE